MKAFIVKFWSDQTVFFATLAALGTAVVAGALTYSASHDPIVSVAAGLGALGIGGTATHSVGHAVQNSTAPDPAALVAAMKEALGTSPVPALGAIPLIRAAEAIAKGSEVQASQGNLAADPALGGEPLKGAPPSAPQSGGLR